MQNITSRISHSKPSLAFSIFCGVTKTEPGAIAQLSGIPEILPWQNHVFQDNTPNELYNDETMESSQASIKDLSGFYYSSFINCLFPSEKNLNQFSEYTESFTLNLNTFILVDGKSILIDYLDLFLFPENHMVYCFKCNLTAYSYDEIIHINNSLRETEIEKIGFLLDILNKICNSHCYNLGNKFKLFTVLEHSLDFSDKYTSDNMLYELGSCSPIGTSVGTGANPSLQPSESYLKQIISNNKISVFENWSALCLFDTFTVLHKGEVYLYNWEFRYFRLLYIHSLFLKSYLGEINKEFYIEKKGRDLENVFFEFNKHFNLKQISYNFLPQLIYDKIRQGLNIEHELTDISFSIEQDYIKKQEKRQLQEAVSDKRTNRALFIVAILAAFTAVWDGSELIETALLAKRGVVFSALSLLALCTVYIAIYSFLKRKK